MTEQVSDVEGLVARLRDISDEGLLCEAAAAIETLAHEVMRLRAVLSDFMENPLFMVAVGGNPNMVDNLMARARAALNGANGNG